MNTKRLFIFAGYDREATVDSSLLYYLHALSKLGDIIFTMDNNVSNAELNKVNAIPNVLHADATRHGEYDFGSYKRGYIWAQDNNILDKYDWVYLVNDSVYGPLFDLAPVLAQMEQQNANSAFGMIGLHSKSISQYGYPEHIQSWFVGLHSKIVCTDWFANFMHSIVHQESKDQIVWKYEIGLSQLLVEHNINIGRFDKKHSGIEIYNGYLRGLPFIKKLAICNITRQKTLKQITPSDLYPAMMFNISRMGLAAYKTLWKIKLFNKITFLMWERRHDNSEYRLWIFKIIPIRFLKYKD